MCVEAFWIFTSATKRMRIIDHSRFACYLFISIYTFFVRVKLTACGRRRKENRIVENSIEAKKKKETLQKTNAKKKHVEIFVSVSIYFRFIKCPIAFQCSRLRFVYCDNIGAV